MRDRLLGLTVKNIKLGKGTIKDFDGDYMIIDFSGVEKKFSYPDAFTKFLSLEDNSLLEEIRNEAKIKQEEKENEAKLLKEQKESQREQLGVLERGSVFMTHNEVLNDCFGYNNKGVFQRAFKVLDGWDKCAVWFPKIAYKLQGEYVSSDKYNHFINILTDADKTIIEKNEDMNEMVKRADKSVGLTRFVFGQFDGEDCYRFLGVFKEEENANVAVEGKKYTRIAEKIDLDNKKII